MSNARRSIITVLIDGTDVSGTWRKKLTSLTINLTDGGQSDTLEAEFDDTGGQIQLPAPGAKISASIRWSTGGGAVTFEGETDDPESSGSRGGGMVLSLSAKSASAKGKVKQKVTKHKDNVTFENAARDFAKASGLTLKIDSTLASIRRDYWSIDNLAFPAWAAEVAQEIGATFKIMGTNAVFVPRNSGNSVSGQALAVVTAQRPGNIISWTLTPVHNRAKYKDSKARWYDRKAASWKTEVVQIGQSDGDASLTETTTQADAGTAKAKAGSNTEEVKRDKGGGKITLDGEAAAQPQALVMVAGIRPGIDGQYRIKSASHTATRSGGWTVSIDVQQPEGAAGKDGRADK